MNAISPYAHLVQQRLVLLNQPNATQPVFILQLHSADAESSNSGSLHLPHDPIHVKIEVEVTKRPLIAEKSVRISTDLANKVPRHTRSTNCHNCQKNPKE